MAKRDFPAIIWDKYIINYTCQSVPIEKLERNWVRLVWEKFWIDAREVLEIPKKLFDKFWYFYRSSQEAQINAENILKLLSKK